MVCRPLLILLGHRGGRERLSWDAAGEWRVIVDVELEEVEEGVVDKVEGAVNFLLNAEKQLEGPAGFVAGREWNVRELARGVGYVLACVAEKGRSGAEQLMDGKGLQLT